jgi:preprotein translocase subunit SecE
MVENTVEEKKERKRKSASDDASLESKGRATPGRRQKVKNSEEGSAFTRPFRNFFSYLSEVNNELKKVTWPTREDTIRLTRIVLIATVVSSLVLGSLAFIADRVVAFGLDNELIFVVLFAAVVVGTFAYMRRGSSAGSSY